MVQDERAFLTRHGLPLPVELAPQPAAIDHPADDSDLPENSDLPEEEEV
ncbi:MAG: hypothetical protein IPO67_24635 [Deltaproteobacteria bacterium]|nr:hypothetical protein [Deltaproteobacteria bacterium]